MTPEEHDRAKYQGGEIPDPRDVADQDVIVSRDTYRENRIPPGQSRTKKWPVLHATTVPDVTQETWSLRVFGLVEQELNFNWEQFQALPRAKVFADFHCVTQWSRLGNLWEGVSTKVLLDQAGIKPEAKFVICHAFDNGWTTNIPLEEFLHEDCLLADRHDGMELNADHGGPVRGIVPRLYAWKGAKWIKAIELSATDRPGFWEQSGYHNLGDPWREQRFGSDEVPKGFYS
ncbi:sulfite oxidase-like oxidoreductase [Blastopirellula marina]|uniref:Oxidoreductase n=1 Tax=Blastopirellula marina TaxID=124 RepID=A0A2S8FXX4_9BACT|nr:sulfite oxidase-like oxidoreductase [Blastopirellula marina]PQO36694.1 oxidoreductase [Blastopirellula marina]PTL44524.1 sulfite oxidase-like oxidoreductase [Blastopirellula marina]